MKACRESGRLFLVRKGITESANGGSNRGPDASPVPGRKRTASPPERYTAPFRRSRRPWTRTAPWPRSIRRHRARVTARAWCSAAPAGGDILEVFPGGCAGSIDQRQKARDVAGFQGTDLGQDPAVFVKHMNGPQDGPVPGQAAHLRPGDGRMRPHPPGRRTSASNRRHTAFKSRGMAAYWAVRSAWSAPLSTMHRTYPGRAAFRRRTSGAAGSRKSMNTRPPVLEASWSIRPQGLPK